METPDGHVAESGGRPSAMKPKRPLPKEPPPPEVLERMREQQLAASVGGSSAAAAGVPAPRPGDSRSGADAAAADGRAVSGAGPSTGAGAGAGAGASGSAAPFGSPSGPPRGADLGLAQAALESYGVPEIYSGRYSLVKLIGKGAYGAVYVALERVPGLSSPRKVAIKHIVNAFVSPTDARRMYREIKVMAHFSHVNIVALTEVIKPRDATGFSHIYLVSELMETDMHRVIHSRQDLTSDHISYFIYQTLCALKHIHAAGVLHRDLKPSNLLVNADCTVKMCDFGLARESDSSLSQALTEYVVTRWYRAPEVLLSGGRYTQAIDVWSVGCILGELLLRRPLFPGENYLHQLQLITEILGSPTEEDLDFVKAAAARNFMIRLPKSQGTPFATLFPHVRGPCLDLLRRMLTFDPSKRISVEECLAHPFLSRVRAARKHVNEDVPPPRPFRLRVQGGSAALRSMTVDAIKARFYAELCGMPLTPTPTGSPSSGLTFAPALTAAATAEAPQSIGGTAGAGAGAGAGAAPNAGVGVSGTARALPVPPPPSGPPGPGAVGLHAHAGSSTTVPSRYGYPTAPPGGPGATSSIPAALARANAFVMSGMSGPGGAPPSGPPRAGGGGGLGVGGGGGAGAGGGSGAGRDGASGRVYGAATGGRRGEEREFGDEDMSDFDDEEDDDDFDDEDEDDEDYDDDDYARGGRAAGGAGRAGGRMDVDHDEPARRSVPGAGAGAASGAGGRHVGWGGSATVPPGRSSSASASDMDTEDGDARSAADSSVSGTGASQASRSSNSRVRNRDDLRAESGGMNPTLASPGTTTPRAKKPAAFTGMFAAPGPANDGGGSLNSSFSGSSTGASEAARARSQAQEFLATYGRSSAGGSGGGASGGMTRQPSYQSVYSGAGTGAQGAPFIPGVPSATAAALLQASASSSSSSSAAFGGQWHAPGVVASPGAKVLAAKSPGMANLMRSVSPISSPSSSSADVTPLTTPQGGVGGGGLWGGVGAVGGVGATATAASAKYSSSGSSTAAGAARGSTYSSPPNNRGGAPARGGDAMDVDSAYAMAVAGMSALSTVERTAATTDRMSSSSSSSRSGTGTGYGGATNSLVGRPVSPAALSAGASIMQTHRSPSHGSGAGGDRDRERERERERERGGGVGNPYTGITASSGSSSMGSPVQMSSRRPAAMGPAPSSVSGSPPPSGGASSTASGLSGTVPIGPPPGSASGRRSTIGQAGAAALGFSSSSGASAGFSGPGPLAGSGAGGGGSGLYGPGVGVGVGGAGSVPSAYTGAGPTYGSPQRGSGSASDRPATISPYLRKM
jgi:mitogen-activated protein kinase 6